MARRPAEDLTETELAILQVEWVVVDDWPGIEEGAKVVPERLPALDLDRTQ